MKSRKFAIFMGLLLIVAMLLAACGPKATPAPTKAPAPTQAPAPTKAPLDAISKIDPSNQTITYWYQHSRAREKGLQGMIKDFNESNPWHITVKGEYQGSYSDIYKKMLAAIAAGEMPNLVVAYQNQAASYELSGALVDVTPYMNSKKYGLTTDVLNDYFPAFINQDISKQFKGMRIGFPPNRSVEIMYYNMDWLKELGYDKPPTSWDKWAEVVCKAAKTPYSKGPADAKPLGYELSIDASRFASMVFSRGGDVMNADQSAYTYNSPEAIAAMQLLQDLSKKGCIGVVTERYGDQSDFGVGKLLFTIGSSSGLPYYKKAVDSGAKFQWGIAPLPHTTKNPVVNIYGASISIVKSTPEKQLASWLFLKWFTEPKQQARWVRISNYFPVRKSTAAELGDLFKELPPYKSAFDLLQYGKTEPPVAGYDVARNYVGQAMSAIMDGADVKSTLDDLNQKANAALKEAQP